MTAKYSYAVLLAVMMIGLLVLAGLFDAIGPVIRWPASVRLVVDILFLILFANSIRIVLKHRRGVRLQGKSIWPYRSYLVIAVGLALVVLSFCWFFLVPIVLPNIGAVGARIWMIGFFVGILCSGYLIGLWFISSR